MKAAADYEGYGKVNMRFPQMYQGFQSANSIRLNSPLEGRLKKGSEQHFSLSTPSYSKIALVLGKNDFKFFEKNQKTGAFELDFAVPGDLNSLDIFASKDGKHFESIISYELE